MGRAYSAKATERLFGVYSRDRKTDMVTTAVGAIPSVRFDYVYAKVHILRQLGIKLTVKDVESMYQLNNEIQIDNRCRKLIIGES